MKIEKQSQSPKVAITGFAYPPSGLPALSNWLGIVREVGSGSLQDDGAPEGKQGGGVDPAQLKEAFEDGRRAGMEEGREAARRDQAALVERLENEAIERAARLNEKFELERRAFMHTLEPEVVSLALHVAERVLHREAHVDPVMLTGAIRVALSQLTDKTRVRLRVPASDAELWSETLAQLPNLRVRPAIVGDERLNCGECELESDLGSVDLSVKSQLHEITKSLLGEKADIHDRDSASS